MTEIVINPTRGDIDRLEERLRELPQAEFPTKHYFANGLYVREMHCKAGTALVGKVHKTQHIFALIQGEMTLVWDGNRLTVKAPFITVSEPGVKRAGLAHTDCICLNIHHSDITDIDDIEKSLVEQDPLALFDAHNNITELKCFLLRWGWV